MYEKSDDFVVEKARKHEWCLCLFFSVDLENATNYKHMMRARQQQDGWTADNDWCAVFNRFYEEFPRDFRRHCPVFSEHNESDGICRAYAPVLWKFAGDEILFYAPLTDFRQTLGHVDAFAQTVINFNKTFIKKGIDLRCKGTAWVAGFPMNNRVVWVPREDRNQPLLIDFIGSSIDTGFRLAKFSSSRRLVVSLDLLWMLAISGQRCRHINRFGWLRYKFHGEHELKGVLDSKPYPIFWVDLEYRDVDLWRVPPEISFDDIISFCKDFAESTPNNAFIRPFLVGDPDDELAEVPSHFEKQHNLLLAYLALVQDSRKHTDAPQASDSSLRLPDNALMLSTIK